jgi:hypothetical protein
MHAVCQQQRRARVPQVMEPHRGESSCREMAVLPAPHELFEIDLASLQLCHKGACIPSERPAAPDGQAHVAAKFDRARAKKRPP